jgi:hypothetical protein
VYATGIGKSGACVGLGVVVVVVVGNGASPIFDGAADGLADDGLADDGLAVGATGTMVGGVLVGDDDGKALVGLSVGMATSSVGMTLGSIVGTIVDGMMFGADEGANEGSKPVFIDGSTVFIDGSTVGTITDGIIVDGANEGSKPVFIDGSTVGTITDGMAVGVKKVGAGVCSKEKSDRMVAIHTVDRYAACSEVGVSSRAAPSLEI